jgi:protein arginine kinase activator
MNCCQFCGAIATIHLTEIHDAVRREMHLCDACGRERDLIPESPGPQFNLPALLHLLFDDADAAAESKPVTAPSIDTATLKCPCCGLKYAQFRIDGRLGCAADYDEFREPLMPLIERIHRGLDHAGKVPAAVRARHEILELRERLDAAVAVEDFEAAAGLRDELKRKDTGPS